MIAEFVPHLWGRVRRSRDGALPSRTLAVVHEVGKQQLERFGIVCVASCAVLAFEFHKRLFLDQFAGRGGLLELQLDTMVAGNYAAPFQYRILAPRVVDWLRDAGLSTYEATAALDLVSLAAAAWLGVVLFRRLGQGWLLTAGAAWFAFMAIGAAYHSKPETYASFAVVSAATLVLADDRVSRAWLIPIALVQMFLRTDLMVALGAGFLVRWWFNRRRRDLEAGGGLIAAAGVATLGLIAAFPDARYPEEFPLFQLGFNLGGESVFVLAALLIVPLFPFIVGDRHALLSSKDGQLGLALIAPHIAEVLITLVVARIMEVRIALPLVWSAALGMCLLWRATLTSAAASETPRASDGRLRRGERGSHCQPTL